MKNSMISKLHTQVKNNRKQIKTTQFRADRRKFLKGALCTLGAVATGCYSSYDIRTTGEGCQIRELTVEEEGSHTVLPLDSRNTNALHINETTEAFAGYKIKLNDISEIVGPSGLSWDRNITVTILNEADEIIESGVILNPTMTSSWTSSDGNVIITANFVSNDGLSTPQKWADITITSMNSRITQEWTNRKRRTEEEQPPSCEEVITSERMLGMDAAFTPGLGAESNYNTFSMFILGEEYRIAVVTPPADTSSDGTTLFLFKNIEHGNVASGEEYNFSRVRLVAEEVGWDNEGLYAAFRLYNRETGEIVEFLDYATGERESLFVMRNNSRRFFVIPGVGDVYDDTQLIYCNIGASGSGVELFATMYKQLLILTDGYHTAVPHDIFSPLEDMYSVTMESNPEGTLITGLSLNRE